MGMPWNRFKTSRSLSPVMIAPALAVKAVASIQSSSGSRETRVSKGAGDTNSALSRTARTTARASVSLNLPFFYELRSKLFQDVI